MTQMLTALPQLSFPKACTPLRRNLQEGSRSPELENRGLEQEASELRLLIRE